MTSGTADSPGEVQFPDPKHISAEMRASVAQARERGFDERVVVPKPRTPKPVEKIEGGAASLRSAHGVLRTIEIPLGVFSQIFRMSMPTIPEDARACHVRTDHEKGAVVMTFSNWPSEAAEEILKSKI